MDEFGKVSLLRPLKESRYALFSKYVITIWKTWRGEESRIRYHFCLQGVYS